MKIFSHLRSIYLNERKVFWAMGGVILAIMLFLLPTVQKWIDFDSWQDVSPDFLEENAHSAKADLLPVNREISWQTLFQENSRRDRTKISQKVLAATGLPAQNLTLLPAAIIVENHTLSRYQQTGLKEADIVYETLAEGGITRFLAIFLNRSPDRVGPVRSARPYFVDWAKEYAGAFVHAGGSREALKQVSQSDNLLDFDEGHAALFRDWSFEKPHNLFTDAEKIKTVLANKEWSKADASFPFAIEEGYALPRSDTQPAVQLKLDFSFPSYAVRYEYSPLKKRYLRWHGGRKHTDVRQGGQIAPRNIIVQITDYYVMDEAGRLDLTTRGTGQIFVFSEGRMLTGKWKKSATDKRTAFFDAEGNELILPPGQTWIEVINEAERVKWE